MINTILASNLRKLRTDQNMSQGQLATAAGIGRKSIIKYEAATGNPSLYTIEDLASVLNVSVIELLTEGR